MSERIAYLTVDDGPSEDFTNRVNYLYSNDIPAIFFCQGDFMKKRPNSVIDAIRKGFLIGNHSYSHPYFRNLTVDGAREEIKSTDEIIENLYQQSGILRPLKVFRFPHFSRGKPTDEKAIQEFLEELEYRQPRFDNLIYHEEGKNYQNQADVWHTFDSQDWKVRTEGWALQQIFERMDNDTPRCTHNPVGLNHPDYNALVVLHDHPENAGMLEPMVNRLISKGFRFDLPRK